MPSLLLVIALVGFLFFGYAGIKERQERAADFMESAAGNIRMQIDAAKQAKDRLTVAVSGATQRIQGTVLELEESVWKVQEGAKNVSDGFSKLGEGVEGVKGAVGIEE